MTILSEFSELYFLFDILLTSLQRHEDFDLDVSVPNPIN